MDELVSCYGRAGAPGLEERIMEDWKATHKVTRRSQRRGLRGRAAMTTTGGHPARLGVELLGELGRAPGKAICDYCAAWLRSHPHAPFVCVWAGDGDRQHYAADGWPGAAITMAVCGVWVE